MATNLNVTLRRGNGTDFDTVYPKTVLAQVIGAQDALDLKINTSARGAANGVASLDSTGKVPVGQLPDAVFDSLYFYDSVDANTDLSILAATALDTVNGRSAKGVYWVALNAITLTAQLTPTLEPYDNKYYVTQFTSGDGDPLQSSENLEIGDWFIITLFEGSGTSGDPYIVQFAVVNNVYETATNARYGITKLSSSTSTTTTGNNVITDGILNGLIGTAAGKIAAGNHNHDSTYLGISANAATASKWATARTITLSGDLTGSVSIDGSANVTLSAEVANGSHTHTVANITDLTATAAELNTLDGITASVTELNYTDGVTSNIQTQLNGKQATITGAATTVVSSNLTASKVLVSDSSGKIAANSVSATTLGFLDATSSIQTQLNSKAAAATTIAGYNITDAYTKTQIDNFLTNRPEIFYDTTVGAGLGDIIIDLD